MEDDSDDTTGIIEWKGFGVEIFVLEETLEVVEVIGSSGLNGDIVRLGTLSARSNWRQSRETWRKGDQGKDG